MARLYSDGDWYDELSPTALSEAEYERLVLRHAPKWFPSYVAAQFKRELDTPHGRTKPDLVLIHNTYREWWVVEVEMIVHSFSNHVFPQVQRLASISLGRNDADYLARATHLDTRKVREMVKGRAPGVLVVLNGPKPEWSDRLHMLGVRVAVAQGFRSSRNRHIFRINGDDLPQDEAVLSYCVPAQFLSGFLCVESPASLGQRNGAILRIRTHDGIGEWARRDIADKVYLVPVGGASPTFDEKRYRLLRVDGGFALQAASK